SISDSFISLLRRSSGGGPSGPVRRDQPALAVDGELDARLLQSLAVPQLAGYLFVGLIEPLAVVGVRAPADLGAPAELHLAEPVRIGQGLAGRRDQVGT